MTFPSARAILIVGIVGSASLYAWRSTQVGPPALFPHEVGDSTRLDVVVVARTEDCTGALSFLDLLERPTLRGRVARIRLFVQGRAADSAAIRVTLTRLGLSVDLSLLTGKARAALIAAGIRTTPMLLVFRHDGTLVLSTPAPETVDEYVAVGSMLEALASRETN